MACRYATTILIVFFDLLGEAMVALGVGDE